MSERNGNLPSGWTQATIDELCALNPKHDRGLPDELPISFVPMAAVSDVLGTITESQVRALREVRKGYMHFADGDVIFAKITPCMENGKAASVRGMINGLACGTTEFYVFSSRRTIDQDFLFQFIRQESYRKAARATMQGGVGQARVPKEFVLNTELPLPPLAEQRRIVERIEALQERSRRAREALAEVGPLLELFRQSVLAAAFRGDLTAGWRAAHPDVEPASELLYHIRAERRRWEEAELVKYEAKGQKPPKDWQDKYEEPEMGHDPDLPELPAGWSWCPLGLLGEDPLNTVQTGPFGAQLHREEFTTEGIPVIAVGNLTGIGFTRKGLYFITEEKAKQLRRYDVQAGDLLFARSGATLGKVCVAPSYMNDWRMMGHILRARLNRVFVVPEIIAFALWGDPVVKSNVTRRIRGMTRPGYNTSLLQSIPIPLPPIDEQRTLLALIAQAFSGADYTADFVQVSLPPILDQLDQSILAKAFRGELVPQDPNDEPASVLLARIQEQRAQQVEVTKGKKKTATTQRRIKTGKQLSKLAPQQLTLVEVL
jgi:type I restriction enzyme, S subunit